MPSKADLCRRIESIDRFLVYGKQLNPRDMGKKDSLDLLKSYQDLLFWRTTYEIEITLEESKTRLDMMHKEITEKLPPELRAEGPPVKGSLLERLKREANNHISTLDQLEAKRLSEIMETLNISEEQAMKYVERPERLAFRTLVLLVDKYGK